LKKTFAFSPAVSVRKEVCSFGRRNTCTGEHFDCQIQVADGFRVKPPQKEKEMKKSIFILLIGLFVVASYSISEAQAYVAQSPFTSSFVETIPNFDAFGDHAVLTYESTDLYGSFFLVLLDYTGTPVADSTTFGYPYLFADVQRNGSLDLYGSYTGYSGDWTFIGNF
jgi:hypothetical protein